MSLAVCQLRKIQEYPRVACPQKYYPYTAASPIAIIECVECEHYHGIETNDDGSRYIRCGLITHPRKTIEVVEKDGT